jgi:hypothetical protein
VQPWFVTDHYRKSAIVFYVLEVLRNANVELELFLPRFARSFDQCFGLNGDAPGIRRAKNLVGPKGTFHRFDGGVMEVEGDFLGFDRGKLVGLQRKKLKV